MAKNNRRRRRKSKHRIYAAIASQQVTQENVQLNFEDQEALRQDKDTWKMKAEDASKRFLFLTNLRFDQGAKQIRDYLQGAYGTADVVRVKILPSDPSRMNGARRGHPLQTPSSGRAIVEFSDSTVPQRMLNDAAINAGELISPSIGHRNRFRVKPHSGDMGRLFKKGSAGSYSFNATQLQVGAVLLSRPPASTTSANIAAANAAMSGQQGTGLDRHFVSEWSLASNIKFNLNLNKRCITMAFRHNNLLHRLDIRFKYIRSRHLSLCSGGRIMFTTHLPARAFQECTTASGPVTSLSSGLGNLYIGRQFDMEWPVDEGDLVDEMGVSSGILGLSNLFSSMSLGLIAGSNRVNAPDALRRELAGKDFWSRCGDFSGTGALGRCLTFVVTLEQGATQGFDDDLVRQLQDFRLLPRSINAAYVRYQVWEALQVIPLSTWQLRHHTLTWVQAQLFALPFMVAWHIQVLLDDSVTTWHHLDANFFQAVHGADAAMAVRTLAMMSHGGSNYGRRFISQPVREFQKLLQETAELYEAGDLDEGLPAHCFRTLRMLLTPMRTRTMLPEVELSNRVVRHFCEEEGFDSSDFLRLAFGEENGDKLHQGGAEYSLDVWFNRVERTAVEGLTVFGKRYEFLAYSSSQLKDQSVWMVHTAGRRTTPDRMRAWMGDFMNIQIPAKCAARMGQCFSSTIETVKLGRWQFRQIPDVEVNGYTFSDGVGTISPSLLRESLLKTPFVTPQTVDEVSAIQVRFQGCKGVLSKDPNLYGRQLCYRPSMAKFSVTSGHATLEICNVAKPIPCYLNRHVILLLTHVGVTEQNIHQKQKDMIQLLDGMVQSASVAKEYFPKLGGLQGRCRSLLQHMLQAGLEPQQEPFMRSCLEAARAHHLQMLRAKARILVEKGTVGMGVLDEQGVLQYGQVYVQVVDKVRGISSPLEGCVVVAKHPVMHQGDVRIFTAVKVPGFESRYKPGTVVFPSRGNRPHPNELSGSDLDGDLYAVMWDPLLMPTKSFPAMDYTASKPALVSTVTVHHLLQHFINHAKNDNLGRIANAWLAHADRKGAGSSECLQLARLHSVAVDFPKTGVPAQMTPDLAAKEWPHWMEKKNMTEYKSTGVLGRMFDELTKHSVVRHMRDQPWVPVYEMDKPVNYYCDRRLIIPGAEKHLEDARGLWSMYHRRVLELMNRYAVYDEGQLLTGCIWKFSKFYKRKEGDVRDQLQREVGNMLSDIRDQFYVDLLREEWVESNEHETAEDVVLQDPTLRMEALFKASACYKEVYGGAVGSVAGGASQASGRIHTDIRVCGMPWVFADLLKVIKLYQFESWRLDATALTNIYH